MSTWIYGYLRPSASGEKNAIMENLKNITAIGFRIETSADLYNWPITYLPDLNCICFSVHDRPNEIGSEYLLDFVDYSPDSWIALPKKREERLAIFTDCLKRIFCNCNIDNLYIAITDSACIENVKTISMAKFHDVLRQDLIDFNLPNTLYIIHD